MKKIVESRLSLLFTIMLTACLLLPGTAEGEKVELKDLLQDAELTFSDFAKFAEQFEDETKFQSLSLNGGINYPSVISAKNAPVEVSELAKQLNAGGEISEQQLKEEYKAIFDNYFSYVDEDEAGNKYLLIINQPVKVLFATNVDTLNVTVDSKPTEEIQNKGFIELAKGQQYQVLVEADGHESQAETIDLRSAAEPSYTVELELKSGTNWGRMVAIVIGSMLLLLVVHFLLGKIPSRRRSANTVLKKLEAPVIADPIIINISGAQTYDDTVPSTLVDPNGDLNTREISYTVAGVRLTLDILENKSERNRITKQLKKTINNQVKDFEIILERIQKIIKEQKNDDFDKEIEKFELQKSRIERSYKEESESINIEIESLKDISRYADPKEEFVNISDSIMDCYSTLGNSFLEGYHLYNEVVKYRSSKKNSVTEIDHQQYGLDHPEVLQMIDKYISPIVSTLASQIKDLQGNVSDFSKTLNNIQKVVDTSITPRIKSLENKQNQSIQDVLKMRKDLKEELEIMSEKINMNIEDSNEENTAFNKKLKSFHENMEAKLDKINDIAFKKLKKYVHDEFETRMDSLASDQHSNASELLKMRQDIIEQAKQIELGQKGLDKLDTKFANDLQFLKKNMDNKIDNVTDTVMQKVNDIIKNKITSRIELLESQQNQTISEILKMRQDILVQSKQIKQAKDALHDFDEKFKTEFEILQENVEEQILQMHNSIVAKLSKHHNAEEQYQKISEQIKQEIKEECSLEVIHSLAVGRYLAQYQKEILNKDASVVFLAYAKAVEKILNPSNASNLRLYEAIEAIEYKKVERSNLKSDLHWIRKKRNDAAHTQSVTIKDVNQVDNKLLEEYINENIFITELIKAKKLNEKRATS